MKIEDVATLYDQMGREFFHKTAGMAMADAGSQYGTGKSPGFTSLVARLTGKLKGGQIRAGRLKRRKR